MGNLVATDLLQAPDLGHSLVVAMKGQRTLNQ